MLSPSRFGPFSALLLTLAAPVPTTAQSQPAPQPTGATPSAEASPTPTPQATTGPLVSGFAQIDYRLAERPLAVVAPHHEFNIRRARLAVAGRITSRLEYSISVQGDGLNANSASFIDAYADLAPWSFLKVRAGQFKYDFDIEGREADHQIPLPDRAFPTTGIAGGLNGGSTPSVDSAGFRDRGVSILAAAQRRHAKYRGSIGIFQGAGRSSDTNSDIAWTVNGQVEAVVGFKLNAGHLSSDVTAAGSVEKGTYSATTVGVAYDKAKGLLRGEYYRGRRRSGTATQDLEGFYVTGSYALVPRLEILARVQRLSTSPFALAAQSGLVEQPGDAAVSSNEVGMKLYLDRRDRRSGSFLTASYQFRRADAGFKGTNLLGEGRGVVLEDAARDLGGLLVVRLQVRF